MNNMLETAHRLHEPSMIVTISLGLMFTIGWFITTQLCMCTNPCTSTAATATGIAHFVRIQFMSIRGPIRGLGFTTLGTTTTGDARTFHSDPMLAMYTRLNG